MAKIILIVLIAPLLLLYHGSVNAADIPAPQWKLSLAAGSGKVENPLAGVADGETFVLPSFQYYGKRFFVTNLTAGYSLIETSRFYIDLIAQPNEDGFYFQLDDVAVATSAISSFNLHYSALPEIADLDRKLSLMAGPSATLVTDWVDVSASWLHDISDVHHGREIHLSLDKRYPLLGGMIGFGIGAIQKDTALVNYYYHFHEEEVGPFAPRLADAFPPERVTDQYARLHFSYPLGKGFTLRLAAKQNQFDQQGRNPMFIAKPETLSWFAGVQYSIGSE